MKRFVAVIFTVLFFCNIISAYAINLEESITVTHFVFSGKGTIDSFDVNQQGNLLICVNPTRSHERYVMLFSEEGCLLKTFIFYTTYNIYASFWDDESIVLYEVHDRGALVIDMNGTVIDRLQNFSSTQAGKIHSKSTLYYDNVIYQRNIGRTKITKSQDDLEEVFFEIEGSASDFIMEWLLMLLVILGGTIFILYQIEKSKRQRIIKE